MTASGCRPRIRATSRPRSSLVVDQLTVEVPEKMVAGHSEDPAGGGHLLSALQREPAGIDRGIERPLVSVGADAHPDLRAGRRPAGQRAAARHLGIVGMGVDGEGRGGRRVDELGHSRILGDAGQRLARPVDAVVVDVVMGHQAHRPGRDGPGPNALGLEMGEDTRASGGRKVTMLVRTDVGPAAGFGPAFGDGQGQAPGPAMVIGQPLDHVVERHQPGCGDDPGLAHAAAETGPLGTGRGP